MPLRKLPPKDSPKLQEAIEEYKEAAKRGDISELDRQAQMWGYANRETYERAMRMHAGVYIGQMPTQLMKKPVSSPNVPLKIHLGKEPQTVAVINDTHNPYQDVKALSLVEGLIEEIQPAILVYAGDMSDFYQISTFDKDPNRIGEMQADINNTKVMFHRHKRILPNTRKILLDGNHEDRWQKFLWSKASALSSLDCLTISQLYDLEEFGIEHIAYEQGLMINDIFLILHGTIASIHSGYTAKRMYEKHGGCGICAHCHRGGSFYKRDRFGTWGWWENFCLCSLDPDWTIHPNWVQGFSLVHFIGTKRFWVEQIPITGHAAMYGGKLYEA